MPKDQRGGFTLLEILVVVVIIIIVFGAMAFGLGGARSSARDDRRKADLALVSSGLEKYRADCGVYPTTSQYNAVATGGDLTGDGSTPACTAASIYIDGKPNDPEGPTRVYAYTAGATGNSYNICASLEQPPSASMDTTACGTCGTACNYIVTNP